MQVFTETEKIQLTGTTAMEIADKLPLGFEQNIGQTDRTVKYIARLKNYSVFIVESGLVLAVTHRTTGEGEHISDAVRMQFVGVSSSALFEGEQPLPGVINHLIGNDPSKWISGIQRFERVRYVGIYPNIDAVFYFGDNGLEFDFILKRGAHSEDIGLRFDDSEQISVDDYGNLKLSVGVNTLSMLKPKVVQMVGGLQQEIPSSFQLGVDEIVRLKLGAYDPSIDLIIDPVIVFSTFLGGTEQAPGEGAYGAALDNEGNTFVTGYTSSLNFPIKNALQSTLKGTANIFVSKIKKGGKELEYSTYLGGSATDFGTGLALDKHNNVYLTGYTNSKDFPVKNAFQPSLAGIQNGFVTKLNQHGNEILYSTYLGGSSTDAANGIAVDVSGSAYVTGATNSVNFPLKNAIQLTLQGQTDAFITKLSPAGNSLIYSTYLGGSKEDAGSAIALGVDGSAFITGYTYSPDMPVINAFQPQLNNQQGLRDAFVAKLNSAGDGIDYCTYLGGSGEDIGSAIAVNGHGSAFVTGTTFSYNFPICNALQPDLLGTANCFITKFAANGKALLFSTYLGGSGYDYGSAIALDRQGNVTIAGSTTSADYPVKKAVQPLYGGNTDAFLTKIRDNGSEIIYSTYLGGSNTDFASAVASDKCGEALAGVTMSADFPIVCPIQASLLGMSDAFIADFSDRALLSISMKASQNWVYVGQSLAYYIYVRNSGSETAGNIIVEDTLPVNSRVLSAISNNGSCECRCGKLIWRLAGLTGSQTAECKVVVQITGLCDAVNIADLISDQGDIIEGGSRVIVVTKIFAWRGQQSINRRWISCL